MSRSSLVALSVVALYMLAVSCVPARHRQAGQQGAAQGLVSLQLASLGSRLAYYDFASGAIQIVDERQISARTPPSRRPLWWVGLSANYLWLVDPNGAILRTSLARQGAWSNVIALKRDGRALDGLVAHVLSFVGGIVLAGPSGGKNSFLIVWEDPKRQAMFQCVGLPVVRGNRCYYTSRQGVVHAVNLDTGQVGGRITTGIVRAAGGRWIIVGAEEIAPTMHKSIDLNSGKCNGSMFGFMQYPWFAAAGTMWLWIDLHGNLVGGANYARKPDTILKQVSAQSGLVALDDVIVCIRVTGQNATEVYLLTENRGRVCCDRIATVRTRLRPANIGRIGEQIVLLGLAQGVVRISMADTRPLSRAKSGQPVRTMIWHGSDYLQGRG